MAASKGMIGLEIHGYLQTSEKLFCRCRNFHDMKQIKPNVNVCPICTGQPGSKPMLPNKSAIDKILTIALLLGCKIATLEDKKVLVFQRKHYNWPDMPSGYQKTISGAHSDFVGVDGMFEGIRIREVHLEEDPAAWNPQSGKVDYNRAGVPLMEVVSEPDFSSSEEVASWLKKFVLTLSYVKALDKDAGIKADVNVSIKGVSKRTEIKNVNSISEIVRAIDTELARHAKEKPQVMETRRWNGVSGKTELMRSKEGQEDYRFIPDPDIPAVKIYKKQVSELKQALPETPMQKLDRVIKKHKIGKTDAQILTSNLEIAQLFEEIIQKLDPVFVLSWITVEWFSVLNYNKKRMDELEIVADHFVELLSLVKDKQITPLVGKDMLRQFVPKSFSVKEKLYATKGVSVSELEKAVKKVLSEHKKSVDDYQRGEKKALNFLIGQVMAATEKRAEYAKVLELLRKGLK